MSKGQTHGRTTIRDVSRLADVSVATVSAVINGKPAVSETLTRQVRRAIEALNYQPDYLARSLRMQRSNILGIVMPQFASSYYAEVLRGVKMSLPNMAIQFWFPIREGMPNRKERRFLSSFHEESMASYSQPQIPVSPTRDSSHNASRWCSLTASRQLSQAPLWPRIMQGRVSKQRII